MSKQSNQGKPPICGYQHIQHCRTDTQHLRTDSSYKPFPKPPSLSRQVADARTNARFDVTMDRKHGFVTRSLLCTSQHTTSLYGYGL